MLDQNLTRQDGSLKVLKLEFLMVIHAPTSHTRVSTDGDQLTGEGQDLAKKVSKFL